MAAGLFLAAAAHATVFVVDALAHSSNSGAGTGLATVALDLGDAPKKVDTIQIHANGNREQGVAFLTQIALSTSSDGEVFGEESFVPVQPLPGNLSQWFALSLGGADVKAAKIRLIDNTPTGWILISEIRVLRPE